MEGLIPMLYKAIKKNNIRRKYRCLSTGHSKSYEFYDHIDHEFRVVDDQKIYDNPMETRGGYDRDRKKGHRRFGSTRDLGVKINEDEFNNFNYGYEYKKEIGWCFSPPKQLVKRSKSHRMFSCIIGEA
ncbi:hypothetical protein RND81_07G094600 [Saponaria officinalis]|uniref:Uncharacterized protein n=1 Tax=Saponaria officinalis TaxID=3572 RepID=A0AAW1JQ09_SAPOF